jgi:hypothetical protein
MAGDDYRVPEEERPGRLSVPLEKTDAAKGIFVRFEKITNVEIQIAALSG